MKIKIVEINDKAESLRVVDEKGKEYWVDQSGCWRCPFTGKCSGRLLPDDFDVGTEYQVELLCHYNFVREVKQ